MNNQMIRKCKYCGQDYCMECSKHEHWQEFCTDSCHDEWQSKNKALHTDTSSITKIL